MDKKSLRNKNTESRNNILSSYAAEAAEKAAEIFCKSFNLTNSTIVAVYYPINNELDTFPLINKLELIGCKIALPCVENNNRPLIFRQFSTKDELVYGSYKIKEPLKSAFVVAPDIIVTPLLAFDKNGVRLGYGGGYYDRTFKSLSSVKKVGYAFYSQYVNKIPSESHDQKLDSVVTEKKIFTYTV